MSRNVVFMISSVIYFSPKPIYDYPTRSIYNPEERAKQTIQTINSIRSKIPNAKIVLIEMGLQEELPEQLHKLADCYVYLGRKESIRNAADSNKSYGEALGLLLADRHIRSLNADFYYKISGRYYLDDNFAAERWSQDGFIHTGDPGMMSTRLYGFPAHRYPEWRRALKKGLPALIQGEPIEFVLFRYLDPKYHMTPLGLTGNIAPWYTVITE